LGINFLKKNICQNKVVANCILAYLLEGFHIVVKDNGIWAEKILMFLLAENPIFTISKSFLPFPYRKVPCPRLLFPGLKAKPQPRNPLSLTEPVEING